MKNIRKIFDFLLTQGQRLNIRSVDLRSADLSVTNLSGASLCNANLSRADLNNSDLSEANLSGADLNNSDLHSADLRSADLSYANLTGTDLRSADLSGADLSGADLRGADLSGADLSGVNLLGTIGLGSKDQEIKFAKDLLDLLEVTPKALNMDYWHSSNFECETTHDLAGFYAPDSEFPGAEASRALPTLARYFYASNDEVIEALERVASGEESVF
jgi:uncharacterized protein YjbI with pentapeptide repeats